MYSAESFSFKISHRAVQLLRLLANYMLPEISIGPAAIAFLTKLFWQVEYDCNWDAVVLPGKLDNRLSCLGLNIRGINHDKFCRRESFRSDVMKNFKRIFRGSLVVFVVRNESPAEIRRENFRGTEMLPGKTRFAGPGSTDQSNNSQFRDGQFHCLLNIPIWVGLPTEASSGPMGVNRTAYPNRWQI